MRFMRIKKISQAQVPILLKTACFLRSSHEIQDWRPNREILNLER